MEINTTEEAIKVLTEQRGFDVENINVFKWRISDEEFKEELKTDEELIFFAREQAKEIEED